MSLTCIWITLLLVVVLLGIRAISCPMARLVAVLAWHVAWRNIRAALTSSALWKSNCKSFAKSSLAWILLQRRVELHS